MVERRNLLLTISLVIFVIAQSVHGQENTTNVPPFWNETLCGAISNDTKNIPYLFNLDPTIEEVVPERGYSTDVEVNFYSTVTGEGKTFHATEVHNFKLVKSPNTADTGENKVEPVLLSSLVDLRFPSEDKYEERIINFRSEDAQGNFHSETFVLSWNKRPGESERNFQPCQTYNDKESEANSGNNLPVDLWPTYDFLPRPMLGVIGSFPYNWFVGPSAAFEQARLLAEQGIVKYSGQETLNETPFILTDVWTYCTKIENFDQYTVKYYFSAPGEVTGPDGEKITTLARPLKVVSIKNGGEEIQTITFHNFHLLEKNVPINVPLQMGCTRLNINDPSDPGTAPNGSLAPPLPDDFFKTDFEIEMEIITRSGDDSFTSSSGSNGKFYHLANYNMTSITQTEIDIPKSDSNASVGVDAVRFKTRSVIDLNDMFMYQIKLSTSECKIIQLMENFNKTNAWDMVPPMTFMMGSELQLFRRDLWTVDSRLNYMGRGIERGIPVLVYEKNIENIFTDELGQEQVATVTQFFVDASKGARYENPFIVNGAPLKLIVTIWDGAKENINREITVNVYKFKSGVIDDESRVREFGITDCFDDSYQSDWFQVVFAIEIVPLIEEAIDGKTGEIKMAFRDIMDVAPNRLPVIDVDYNDAGLITISAQLLDRPDWYYLFSFPTSGQIKPGPLTGSFLIETPAACAKKCLINDECTDFSYCNNMECDLFLGGKTAGAKMEVVGMENGSDADGMNDCLVYSKSSSNKKTNDQILDELEININRKNFKISINFVDESGYEFDKDLIAIELKKEVAPGFGDWEGVLPKVGKGDDFDVNHWISDYEIKLKGRKFAYNKDDPDNRIFFGEGISSCAYLCNEDESCNSFSFCNKNKILECIVTTKHGSEIAGNSTLGDPNCNIISKNFLVEYERHPNLRVIESASYSTLVSSDVECAKLCSTNKTLECESFDFCTNTDDVSETGSFTCLTHKYHLAMSSEIDRDTQQIKLDLNTTICEHFTKKYTKDYTATKDRKLKEDVPFSQSVENLSLESCASTCSEFSNTCSTFEFCETLSPNSPTEEVTTDSRSKPSRSCKLVTEKLTNVKERSVSNENCIVYVVTKTAQIRSRNKPGSADSSSGVSPVAVGLVSVLFLLLGAVGGVFGYRWYKNRSFV